MIKKQALDFFEGTAPIAGTPAPSAGSPVTPVSGTSTTNAGVLKMQTAMENFANKVKGGNIPVNIPRNLIQDVEKISGQARFADGAWGPITQTALQDIANLASSLTLLSERFGLNDASFNKEDAVEFKKILSECVIEGNHITLSQEDQSATTVGFTERINGISELYGTILGKVQTVSNEGILKPNEQKIIQTGRVVVTYVGRPLEVPLFALTSPTNYSQFCTTNNLDDKAKTELLDIIMNSSRAT